MAVAQFPTAVSFPKLYGVMNAMNVMRQMCRTCGLGHIVLKTKHKSLSKKSTFDVNCSCLNYKEKVCVCVSQPTRLSRFCFAWDLNQPA